jgi:hypothetical protein
MGPTMQVLSRWVREFAAGIDAGNAIRHGRPVGAGALRDDSGRDVGAGAGSDADTGRPAGAAQPASPSVPRPRDPAPAPGGIAAPTFSRRRARIPTSKAGA